MGKAGLRALGAAAALLLGSACSSSAERAAAAMADYEIAYNSGDLIAAREAARKAVSERDDVADYWLQLGRVELALRDPGGAYLAYTRALELDKNNMEALQNLADLAFLGRDLNQARELAERQLKIDPRNSRASLTLGFIAIEKKQWREAEARAEDLLKLRPLDPTAMVLKARAMAGGGKPREAAALLEQTMRIRGTDPAMLDALAAIYPPTGDEAALQRTYARILRIAPANTDIQLSNLRLLYRTGQGRRAFEIIQGLQARHPDDSRLFESVADIWLAAPAAAVPLAEVRRLAATGSRAVRTACARFLLERGSAAEAAQMLRPLAAGEISAANADAAALYASALHRLGDADAAFTLAGRVLEFDQRQPRALRLRAGIALARRDLDQALADASILVADQPGVAGHRLLIARIYEERGNRRLAEIALKKAARDFPADRDIRAAYAAFLRRNQRSTPALAST